MKKGSVYLVHLNEPVGRNKHYMGFSTNVERRLARHRTGHGAKLLRRAKEKGVDFSLVRQWNNVTPQFERELKRANNGPRFCPVCNPKYAATNKTKGNVVLQETL